MELVRLLELVNLVPPDMELPDLEAKAKENLKALQIEYFGSDTPIGSLSAKTENATEYLKQMIGHAQKGIDRIDHIYKASERLDKAVKESLHLVQAIEHGISGLPEPFKKYVEFESLKQRNEDALIPYRILYKYNFVKNARENFFKIISYAERGEFPSLPVFGVKTNLRISSDGLIEIERDEFLRAIEDVEAKRLRLCEICGRIFWAGRLDQQCCSSACAHALRNRRYRARYKDDLVRRYKKESEGK